MTSMEPVVLTVQVVLRPLLEPVVLTVGVGLGPVVNFSKSFQINCVKVK